MQTGYKIQHLSTGTLSQTAYTSMTAATLALFDAAPHSQSEYAVVLVQVCGHDDTAFLSPCCFAHMTAHGHTCPECHEACVPERWCFACDQQVAA